MMAYKFIKNKKGEVLFFYKRFADNEKTETIEKWRNKMEKLAEKGKIKNTNEIEFISRMRLSLTHSYHINNSNVNIYENEKVRFIKITSKDKINYREEIEKIEEEIEIEDKSKIRYILTKR